MAHLTDKQFTLLTDLFRHISGNYLPPEKKAMVESRLRRRLYLLGLQDFGQYLKVLNRFPVQEIPHLVSALTTHTTKFFREDGHFQYLTQELLPKHFLSKRLPGIFRVWSAACSSGEEPYSIAMVIDHYLKSKKIAGAFEIYATDIDRLVVEKGRKGIYPIEGLASIPEEYRHYARKEKLAEPLYFKIADEIAGRIDWSTHNLKDDRYVVEGNPKFDAIFVRNVFIYFSQKEVERAVGQFARFLKPEGHLFLGMSENMVGLKTDFTLLKSAIFKLNPVASTIHSSSRGAQSSGPVSESKPEAIMGSTSKIRLLVVDDSKTIHKLLEKVVAGAPDMEIVGYASNGKEALEFLRDNIVDVISSDIHMPEMDGIQLLTEQMKRYRIPTVMFSSVSKDFGCEFLGVYDKGAVEYIEKPNGEDLGPKSDQLLTSIRAAATSRMKYNSAASSGNVAVLNYSGKPEKSLILIGASTGGPDAITTFLKRIPKNCPPIVIVQHMPPVITKAFADRLDAIVEPEVLEASDGASVIPGRVLLAPGGRHMVLHESSRGELNVRLLSEQVGNEHRPSVDRLFQSAVPFVNARSIIAVLMTGMGKDGASSITALHQLGIPTIAQDEESSAVFGMAKAAIALGGIDYICPVSEIAEKTLTILQGIDGRAKKLKAAA